MRTGLHAMATLAVLSSIFVPVRMAAQSDEAQRVQESVTVFNEIMTAPDKAFLTSVLNKAEGIAVFPGTIKGIGAQHGRGILSAQDNATRVGGA